MPRREPTPGRSRVPSYRLHKPSGQAVVTLSGRDVYLGRHGSATSRREYERVLAEWLAAGRRAPGPPTAGITVQRLAIDYTKRCAGIYKAAPTMHNIRNAMRRLRTLYGHTAASEFSPRSLKAIREAMIADGLARPTINKLVGIIRAAFAWGVEEGMVPASVHHGLLAVKGLVRGRSEARETEPVRPVADAVVNATLPHLPPMVGDMVRLQRLTGARPAEVCGMTAGELDTSGPVWLYQPREHKTAHHGHARIIAIGPKAQAILKKYLRPELDKPLFSPAASVAECRAIARARRKTPVQPSQTKRAAKAARRKRRQREPGERYDTAAYRRAIERACARAFPHPTIDAIARKDRTPEQVAELKRWRREHVWAPNQLRHTRATELRKAFGLDAAGAVLGHTKLETTQVYAERNMEVAARVALATG